MSTCLPITAVCSPITAVYLPSMVGCSLGMADHGERIAALEGAAGAG